MFYKLTQCHKKITRMHQWKTGDHPVLIQGGPKNWHIFVRLMTLSNIGQFSNFFSLAESGELVVGAYYYR